MADTSTTVQKVSAEALGTFVLVFFGCGSVIYAGNGFQSFDIVAVGPDLRSCGDVHGLRRGPDLRSPLQPGGLGRRRDGWPDVVEAGPDLRRLAAGGAIVAGLALFVLLQGYRGFESEGGMGQNSFGDEGSGYAWWAAFLLEVLLTAALHRGHPRRHRRPLRAPGTGAAGHRPHADRDPLRRDPGDRHLGQPRPLDRRPACSRAATPSSSSGCSSSPRSSAAPWAASSTRCSSATAPTRCPVRG